MSASRPAPQLRSRLRRSARWEQRAPCGLPVSGSQSHPEQTEHEGPREWCLVCNECEIYKSERRSCLVLPPLLSGLREHSKPTVPHSTIAPQIQVPSDRPGPTPELSPSPRDSSPHLGRAAPACQKLNWEQDGQVIRTPARQSPRTMQGCYPNRDVIAFTTVFYGPHRFSTAFLVNTSRGSLYTTLSHTHIHTRSHMHTQLTHPHTHTHLHSHAHTTHTCSRTCSHIITFTQEHT